MAKKESKTPKPNGRPPRILTQEEIETVEKLAALMASWDEIGAFIGWPKSTLEKKEEAKDAFHKGMAKATLSLKRAMFENATKRHNATIQIWLSKIHLGYKEQTIIDNSGEGPAHVSIGVFKG